MKKTIFSFLLFAMVIAPAMMFALPVAAQDDVLGGSSVSEDPFGKDYAEGIGLQANRTPQEIAASVIQVIMTFLGIVAVVVILLGGFKWMTAAGSEDKVDEAKKLIRAGIIGLVIIIAAWAIASWVIDQMSAII